MGLGRLLGLYNAYYGGFTCVCWSPDGKYVLTGGQDDLISIWCPEETTLIARCQGHQSWVTSVAFDPWRCDEKNYRFGSVGEDCRLCLWDFNVGMLHKPKIVSGFLEIMLCTSAQRFSHHIDNAVQSRPAYRPYTAARPRVHPLAGYAQSPSFRSSTAMKPQKASTILSSRGLMYQYYLRY